MYKSLLRQRLQNLKRILPQFLKYFYKIKMYYELLYSTKFENLEENDEIINLQKIYKKKQKNLNNCTFIKDTESTI